MWEGARGAVSFESWWGEVCVGDGGAAWAGVWGWTQWPTHRVRCRAGRTHARHHSAAAQGLQPCTHAPPPPHPPAHLTCHVRTTRMPPIVPSGHTHTPLPPPSCPQELYRVPEQYLSSAGGEQGEEPGALTGISEVPLSARERMANFEAVERAKRNMLLAARG